MLNWQDVLGGQREILWPFFQAAFRAVAGLDSK